MAPINPPDGWTPTPSSSPYSGGVVTQWGAGVTTSSAQALGAQTSTLLTGANVSIMSRLVPINRYNTPATSFNYGRPNLTGVYLYGTATTNSVTVSVTYYNAAMGVIANISFFTGNMSVLNAWQYYTGHIPVFSSAMWAQFFITTGPTHSGNLYVGGVDLKPTRPTWQLTTTGKTLPTTPAAISWDAIEGGEVGIVGGAAGTTLQIHTAGVYFFSAIVQVTTYTGPLLGTQVQFTVSIHQNGGAGAIFPAYAPTTNPAFFLNTANQAFTVSGSVLIQNVSNVDGSKLTFLIGASVAGNVVSAQWSGFLVG